MTIVKPALTPADKARQTRMGLLARANPARLSALLPAMPVHDFLRRPEVGAVMVQGRVGAVGAPFNLGEMSVTRCSVRLATGEVGHAHVQGRDKIHATQAAIVDAMMQGQGAAAMQAVLDALATEEAQTRLLRAEKAAATKVEFFTLVRGEDQ